ncbi:unnamed protein product [Mycena citricolor]|uniref:HMG box domain-containing protein n=1 Tax=Mycena citricolor TaxID=2018698 RepID=A0AAD2H4P9_9AGAR|nr:unnamed protein product [Mycena citricolor]
MPPPIMGWSPSNAGGDIVDESTLPREIVFPAQPASSPSSSSDAPRRGRIPRPRNAFIMFRQWFVQHRPSKRSLKGAGSGVSVSREASIAWHALLPDQKQYFYKLAEIEKKRHALQYPGYQFKPRRNPKGSSQNVAATIAATSCSAAPSPALSTSSFVCRAAELKRPSSAQTVGQPTLDYGSPAHQTPPMTPPPESVASASLASIKADRRRSSSVPVTSEDYIYMSRFLAATENAAPFIVTTDDLVSQPMSATFSDHRRSRSLSREWPTAAPAFEAAPLESMFLDPRSPQHSHEYVSSFNYFPPRSPNNATLDPAALFLPNAPMPPLDAVASSLVDCEGAPPRLSPMTTSIIVTPVAPTAKRPPRVTPPLWLGIPSCSESFDLAALSEGSSPPESVTEQGFSPPLGAFEWDGSPLMYPVDVGFEDPSYFSQHVFAPEDLDFSLPGYL